MARLEIVVCRSNGEAVFSGFTETWLWGSKMDKMVTRGRLPIHLKNASKLSKEWGEGQITEPKVVKMDAYKLEIFSLDGILLGEVSLTHHANGIRIFRDNLFIREDYNTIFYQYKIIEK